MKSYKYFIIGGGMTGDAAVRGIRQRDNKGRIGLISNEQHPPYNRPPLSKDLWTGMQEKNIWRHTEELSVDPILGRHITKIDPEKHTATDDAGETYGFEKLLLATGGTPRKIANSPDDVNYFRTYQDYLNLRNLVNMKQRFVVIGGGFIGSEIAAALAKHHKKVAMVFPEDGIGGRIFPADHAKFLNEYYKDHNIDVRSETLVESITKRESLYTVSLDDGTTLEADGVIAGLGIQPNTELAEQIGLEVSDGIEVNEYLQTSHPDIFAAGDVARTYNSSLDSKHRFEHEENANTQGMTAGENMAGGNRKYDYLPFFYSDLFDLGYEAVGTISSKLEIVTDWMEPNQKGVFYYLKDGRVRGVLLWNVWEQVEDARKLIAEKELLSAEDLQGRILD